MKNKKLLYLLIPLTIVLWGGIVFKIIKSVSGTDEAINYNNVDFKESKQQLVLSDTFSIGCNYSDPFLGKKTPKVFSSGSNNASSANHISKAVKEKKQVIVSTIVWPEIIYRGIIKNQKSNKQLALVQINGKGNAMKAGESVDNIELTKVFKDSIEVKFGKEKRYIRQ